jgi:hypothetical protein
MRLRSIKPFSAICNKLDLMLGTDHMPNCFQSNRPETAFSCAIGAIGALDHQHPRPAGGLIAMTHRAP